MKEEKRIEVDGIMKGDGNKEGKEGLDALQKQLEQLKQEKRQ